MQARHRSWLLNCYWAPLLRACPHHHPAECNDRLGSVSVALLVAMPRPPLGRRLTDTICQFRQVKMGRRVQRLSKPDLPLLV